MHVLLNALLFHFSTAVIQIRSKTEEIQIDLENCSISRQIEITERYIFVENCFILLDTSIPELSKMRILALSGQPEVQQ